MRTLELFSGTKSFSKVAELRGHKTSTVDNEVRLNPTWCESVLDIKELPIKLDMVWTSPPCTAFSVASIGKHWDKETRLPKSEGAEFGLKLLDQTIKLIAQSQPKYWFIENPRGMMRKVIDKVFSKYGLMDYVRHTVTYCQYGDDRMKPTDIWTNCHVWQPKEPCKNGMDCHVSAPRGSRTGTQGINGAKARGVIPPAIFEEIFLHIKENNNDRR